MRTSSRYNRRPDEPPRQRVALIGATRSCVQAPWTDRTWEVWGCNALWDLCRDERGDLRADRWFDMHPRSAQSEQDMANMHACPVPLYVPDKAEYDDITACLAYPYEFVAAHGLVAPFRPYFTCTFAYQIALAMALGFDEIGLYGINLTNGREGVVERACVEYWLGKAEGVGLTVTLPPGHVLLDHPSRYGYDYQREIDETTRHMEMIVRTWREKYREPAADANAVS